MFSNSAYNLSLYKRLLHARLQLLNARLILFFLLAKLTSECFFQLIEVAFALQFPLLTLKLFLFEFFQFFWTEACFFISLSLQSIVLSLFIGFLLILT